MSWSTPAVLCTWALALCFQGANAAGVAHAHWHAHDEARDTADDAHVKRGASTKAVAVHAQAQATHFRNLDMEVNDMGLSHTISLKRQLYRDRAGNRNQAGAGMGVVHKTAYYGQIEVGQPRQPFTVVFDSGSGNLMIPSTYCKSKACTMHKQFNRKASTSAIDIQADGTHIADERAPRDQITVTFGTGEITGVFLQDDVCIGNSCEKMSLVGATDETDDPFSSFRFDGVLGLARSPMSQGPEFNFFNQMVDHRKLRKPVFSVFLSDSDAEDSEVTLGDIKQEHMASDMLWSPVSKDTGYWQVQIDDIAINNIRTTLCEGCQVAVDTGTSQLAGPSDVIAELSHKLNVLNSCENYDRLPVLGFALGDRVLNLQPQDYVDKGADGCEVSLMKLDVPPPNGPLFVLGDPFLRKFYTAYDRAKNRVGFAVARHADSQGDEASAIMATLISKSSGEVHRVPAPTAAFLAKH